MHVNKDVGVIITRFNETKLELGKAVESVRKNGIPLNSILVINDNPLLPLTNSDVGGANLINNVSRCGVSYSRNLGIRFFDSKEWIGFLDADDMWEQKKIDKQLTAALPTTNLVSTGMLERSWYGDLVRIPSTQELAVGGNPCFMSSVIFRRATNIFFEDRELEDRAFISNFRPEEITIVAEALVQKFNYVNRRGKSLIASFQPSRRSTNLGSFSPLSIFFFKIKSIKALKPRVFRVVFFLLMLLGGAKETKLKRVGLSINFLSSEYKFVKEFSKKYGFKLLPWSFPLGSVYTRNRLLLEGVTFRDCLLAWICSRLEPARYVYVGLPGARWVRDVLDKMPLKKFIHVCHGKPSSEKFLKFTYGALVFHKSFKLNSSHTRSISSPIEFIYAERQIAWIHGFKKGRSYGLANLIQDLKVIRVLNSKNRLVVYPHPSANLLKIILHCLFIPTKKLNKFGTTIVSGRVIYVSSPSVMAQVENLSLPPGLSLKFLGN